MKIILCTCYYYKENKPAYIYYTDKLKQLYCNKYSMTYYNIEKEYYPDFHPYWYKLPALKQCFMLCESEEDWIIWMDADAAPVNMNFNISDYLKTEQKKIIMLKDLNGFNCGIFAIPNIDRAKKWVDYIDNQRFNQQYKNIRCCEQQAMIDSFDKDYSDFYKIPPQEIGFNNYIGKQEYNTFEFNKSWCLHVANYSSAIRNKWFYYFYDKQINDYDINIIIPEDMFQGLVEPYFITATIDQVDKFDKNIAQFLYLNQNKTVMTKFIGFNTITRYFTSISQIKNANNILKQYDIILGESQHVENILKQFIIKDLFYRSDNHDYEFYIQEFNNIFDENEMNILLNNQNMHFGGHFITSKEIYYNYYNYFINKLEKFKLSKLFNVINDKQRLAFVFHERILWLYCLKNHLKPFILI